jgi:hypothetical protein
LGRIKKTSTEHLQLLNENFMKKIIAVAAFALLASQAFAQENMVTLNGGYSFANVEDHDVNVTGWRISGVYEFNPLGSKFAHGLSVGYVSLSGEGKENLYTITYDISSWPIYYAPKFLFGGEKAKGFIKGAIGYQFSKLQRTGEFVEATDNDAGFTGGGGAGVSYFFNEKFFLTAEYELIWMSNSFYKDGWLNTASVGLGIKF